MQRQITIKGTHSDWYEQATFILKPEHTHAPPKNLVSFADDLVEDFLKKSPPAYTYPSTRHSYNTVKPHSSKAQSDKYINYFLYISFFFLFIVIFLCFSLY